jgi:hypothetical protein
VTTPSAPGLGDGPDGPPTLDPAVAYPEINVVRELLQARDWTGVEGFFGRLPGESERAFFAGAVEDVAGSEELLAEEVKRERVPGLAHTLLGGRYITIGWDIRTARRAKDVSSEQFAALHDYLRRAETLLIDATAARPDNVAAWSRRLTTSMGLELGQSESRRRYDQLARTDPHNLQAQRRMVQLLCPKWSGSWEAMFAFARECAWSAPLGSHCPAVLVEAHIERGFEEGRGYFDSDEVRRDINAAAERSIGHPDYRPGYGWTAAQSLFAYAFSRMGDYPRAAYSFRALGRFVAPYPWSGDRLKQFREFRDQALAKG